MEYVQRIFLNFTLLLSFDSIVFAQDSPKLRKFQTTYKIDMYAEADVNTKKIGNVPLASFWKR